MAEDQDFAHINFLENITVSIYPFVREVPGIHEVINYIVSPEIGKQIKAHFNEQEAGSKV